MSYCNHIGIIFFVIIPYLLSIFQNDIYQQDIENVRFVF